MGRFGYAYGESGVDLGRPRFIKPHGSEQEFKMTTALPIALQLYTVREALAADWEGTLEKIAAMGYVGVESAGFGYAPSPEVAIAKIQGLGMEIMAAHAPLLTAENADELLGSLKMQGASRIVCAGMGRDQFGSVESVQGRVEVFNAANAIAKAAGAQFGVHNHWWEFANIDGRSGFDVMIDLGLDDDIFFELDTYWIQTSWLNAVEVVGKYSARTPLLHIKDGPTGKASNMVAVGDGVMDVAGVIAAGKGAEWLVVELDRCDSDMMTAVEGSINYLVANGLGRGR